MEDNEKNAGKTAENKRVATGRPFVKGDPRINMNGRPAGVRNFTTDFEEAIKGMVDKKTGKQLTMEDIIKTGIVKMLNGNARFEGLYKDLLDRHYGKPKQSVDLTGSLAISMDPAERAIIEKAIDDL